MLVVLRWWCPYTTGPSPATRIWASAIAGVNSRMGRAIPVNKRFMNISLAAKSTRFRLGPEILWPAYRKFEVVWGLPHQPVDNTIRRPSHFAIVRQPGTQFRVLCDGQPGIIQA